MSATVTAEIPRSGREALLDDRNGAGLLQTDVDLNARRYFVQMGFDIVSVATQAIPMAKMWRGDIVPCTTIRVVDSLLAIPETERIPGSERPTGSDGKLSVAERRSYAFHEAEALIHAEDRTEKKSCIFEIKSLYSELGHRIYRELDLTRLFFPGWPRLPDKNEEVLNLLETQTAIITANPPSGIPSELQPQVVMILAGIGSDLIAAARRTQEFQRDEIIYTHQCMKLRPNEDRYKPRYDSRDYEILTRTGLPKIDAAEIQTAFALEKLTNTSLSGDGDTRELIAMMREQSARQNQIIELLLAERQPAKIELSSEPVTPKAAPKGK